MQITLSPHAQELVEIAVSRGFGRTPEEVIERALEDIERSPRKEPELTEEERQRGEKSVDEMLAWMENNHFTLNRDRKQSLQKLMHEGHKY